MMQRKILGYSGVSRFSSQAMVSWIWRGGLVFLFFAAISCSKFPGDELNLSPGEGGTCNPIQQLQKNPLYLVKDIKTGNTTQGFVNLFERGEEWGCLVSMWEGRPVNREEGRSYVTMVRLSKEGNLSSLEPVEGKSTPVLRIPSDSKLKGFHFLLYVVQSTIVVSTQGQDIVKIQAANDNAREGLSAEERKIRIGLDTLKEMCRIADSPQYGCFSKNRNDCQFFMKLYVNAPKLPDVNTLLAQDNNKRSCVLCSPEVCNGIDDDCDGYVDNMKDPATGENKLDAQGKPESLTRECYDGKGQDLVNIERSKGTCKAGVQTCTAGKWSACVGQRLPEKEVCNGFDDDCDGRNDDSDDGPLCKQGEACENGKCVVTVCRPGQTECLVAGSRLCVDLLTDRANCGVCGKVCNSGEVCAEALCRISCPGGQTKCGEKCVDTANDRLHCNGCDKVCGTGEVCVDSKCQITCLPGQTKCNLKCVDIQEDRLNCGTCDKTCGSGEVCVKGNCQITCPTGQTKCNTKCSDLQEDRLNCGACGKVCGSGEVCVSGGCQITCPTGQTKCNQQCVDTQTDRLHCSACGKVCQDGYVCVKGVCQITCPTGQTKCSEQCVDTKTDRLHCGACGKVCKDGESCVNSVCVLVCSAPLVKCNDKCVDTQTDLFHCSGCGKACNSGEVCVSGICQISCPPGQTKCNNQCVNTKTDKQNCGKCNLTCGAGQDCVNSLCELVCPPGQQKCGTGCCSLGQICCKGNVCAEPNVSQTYCGCTATSEGQNCTSLGQVCQGGSCGLVCPGGQQACGSVCCAVGQICCKGNVCSDPKTDANRCGCSATLDGVNCAAKGESCANGTCSSVCGTGTVKCGGSCCPTNKVCCQGNVCVDPQTDAEFCGCSVVSKGTDCKVKSQTCELGLCVDCTGGLTKCGGQCVDTQTDKNNCGTCGKVCGTGESCVSGNCTVSCSAGETPCGTSCCGSGKVCCQGNVCVDPQTERTLCGCTTSSSGTNCATTGKYCASGTCQSCPTGLTLCEGRCVDIKTNTVNCGKCISFCAAGQACENGLCVTKTLQCGNGETACGSICCPGNKVCCRGSVCTDPKTDPLHCDCSAGYAGNHCGGYTPAQRCVNTLCQP